MRPTLITALALLTLAPTLGCASARLQSLRSSGAEPGIVRFADGESINEATLVKELATARYVLVGETHDNAADHAIQLKVIDLLRASGRVVAIGMEMFQRPFQPALDAYCAGSIEQDELLIQTEWETRWNFDVELYQGFWERCRDGSPLVALNVRRELTKRVSGSGLDALTPGEKADIVELDLTDDRYRTWLKQIFSSHGMTLEGPKFERFFAAQVLWDETMADSAFRGLQATGADVIVLVVGRGHVERDFGIAPRIRRRAAAEYGDGVVLTIVPKAADDLDDATYKEPRFADYLWVR